jgi:hypothetical protein
MLPNIEVFTPNVKLNESINIWPTIKVPRGQQWAKHMGRREVLLGIC